MILLIVMFAIFLSVGLIAKDLNVSTYFLLILAIMVVLSMYLLNILDV